MSPLKSIPLKTGKDSLYGRASSFDSTQQNSISSFVNRTYGWMFLGLALTGFVSMGIASSETAIRMVIENRFLFYALLISEVGLVLWLSARMNQLTSRAAALGFLAYSALNGVTLSLIFMVYTLSSIGHVFMIAAGMFGGLALFGTVTKKDLSGIGAFFGMGIWGLLLVGVANIFIQSEALSLGMSLAGVLIFAGLTAYDSQRIRAMAYQYASSGQYGYPSGEAQKGAIFGALILYLDFINLFLNLLRLFGQRRD